MLYLSAQEQPLISEHEYSVEVVIKSDSSKETLHWVTVPCANLQCSLHVYETGNLFSIADEQR